MRFRTVAFGSLSRKYWPLNLDWSVCLKIKVAWRPGLCVASRQVFLFSSSIDFVHSGRIDRNYDSVKPVADECGQSNLLIARMCAQQIFYNN
jgi:hypothetical protein